MFLVEDPSPRIPLPSPSLDSAGSQHAPPRPASAAVVSCHPPAQSLSFPLVHHRIRLYYIPQVASRRPLRPVAVALSPRATDQRRSSAPSYLASIRRRHRLSATTAECHSSTDRHCRRRREGWPMDGRRWEVAADCEGMAAGCMSSPGQGWRPGQSSRVHPAGVTANIGWYVVSILHDQPSCNIDIT